MVQEDVSWSNLTGLLDHILVYISIIYYKTIPERQ